MKKITLFISALLLLIVAHAQDISNTHHSPLITELKNSIKGKPNNTDWQKEIEKNSPEYSFLEGYRQKCLGIYTDAKILLHNSIKLCPKNSLLLSEIYHEISLIHHYQSSNDSAIVYAEKEIANEKLNDTIIKTGYALSNIAVYYKFINHIDSALKYNKYALKTFRETKDSLGIAKIENNLGNLYQEIDINSSIQHFEHALELYSALNKLSHKAYVEHNLGIIYMNKGLHQKALKYIESSNTYALKDNYFYAINSNNMGLIYLNMKEYDKAQKYLLKSLESNLEANNTKAHTFLNLGALYIETKQYQKAEANILKSKEIAKRIDYIPLFKSIYKTLSDLYARSKQPEKFKIAFDKYTTAVDSFYANKYREKLAEFDQKLEVEKTRKELQLSHKDKEIQKQKILKQEAKIQSKNSQLIFGVIILLLIIALLITFAIIARKQKHLAKAIEKQKNSILVQNEELEIAVLERTKELELATQKAKESDVLKSSFLANISHEVRTPLNSIMGFSDLITEDCESNQLQQYANIIRNNGFNLLNIINDLIDVSKIESNMFEIYSSMVSYHDLIENIQSENENKASYFGKNGKVSLKWQFTNYSNNIFCDYNKLLLVFDKLISNAFQFTQTGIIEVGSVINSELITFYVKDSGIGIEEKFIHQVFENFRKIDKQDTINRGLGVGLFISKYIITEMGSKLIIESVKGKGTQFSFDLQINKK